MRDLTFATHYQLARPANSTAADFPSKVPTATEPTGTGVIDLATTPGQVARWLRVLFFGTDAANETFSAKVIGWAKAGTLWIPTPLVVVTATLGASPGIAGTVVDEDQFFADTIATATVGKADVTCYLYSPADDTIASLKLLVEGFAKVEITFDMTLAASGNALVAQV